jgi:hypothetical protein
MSRELFFKYMKSSLVCAIIIKVKGKKLGNIKNNSEKISNLETKQWSFDNNCSEKVQMVWDKISSESERETPKDINTWNEYQ